MAVVRNRLGTKWLLGGLLAVFAAAGVGLAFGPVNVGVGRIIRDLAGSPNALSPTEHLIVYDIRLPRVVLGGLVGWMLAAGGATYQAAFHNPLADPYLLGSAAGAGLGVTLVIVNGWSSIGIPLAAFVGAVAAVAITYAVSLTVDSGRSTATIVLAGVAVSAMFTAAQTYVQQRGDDTLRKVYAWILGRLTNASWADVRLVLPYIAVSSVMLLVMRRHLDVLRVGDAEATSLGLPAQTVRVIAVAAATLGVAAAVSVSGLIGFVGIIVPHAVRLGAGGSYRRIVPLSMLFGAAFLIVTDLFARTLQSPAELPLGVLTAFCGAPFFLFLLWRSRQAPWT